MEWKDITLPLTENMPHWPGDKPFQRKVTAEIGKESNSQVSYFCSSNHFGTHMDAPSHFFKEGKTIDQLKIDLLVGPCQVIEISSEVNIIKVEHIKDKVQGKIDRLLVKSDNSKKIRNEKFNKDYTAFSPEAVSWLVNKNIKLLGLDYYSIGPYNNTKEIHDIFLKDNNRAALEAIDLSEIDPGNYELIALPLKLKGASGAPTRVLLGKEN